MSDKELLDFMQRILISSNSAKAWLILSQLKDILSQQNASEHQIRLLEDTMQSVQEAKEVAQDAGKRALTEEDLKIAAHRAAERRRREQEMRDRGRC